MISKCSKLAQKKHKTWHDWVGKVIPSEFCKKLKFDHTYNVYKYNPEPLRENEMDKHRWDFERQQIT